LRRKLEGHHVADIVRDEIELLDTERREHAGKVGCLILLVEAARRFRRQAQTAQIGDDH